MAVTVSIGGSDRKDYVKALSLTISGGLRDYYTLSAVIEDRRRGWIPVKGSAIVVQENGTTVFAGNLMRVVCRMHAGSQTPTDAYMQYSIEASDYNLILFRRLVTATYNAGSTLGQILTHLVSFALSGEGITVGTIPDPDPVIDQFLKFDHETVDAVLTRLQSLTGLFYKLGFDKVLDFNDFTADVAPFSLTQTSDNWSDLESTHDDAGYRNRQHIQAAGPYASALTETFIATEGQMQFPTSQVIALIQSITVNGTAKTYVQVNYPNGSWPAPGSAGYDFSYFGNMPAEEFDAVVWADIHSGDVVVVRYMPYLRPNADGSAQGPNTVTENDLTEQAARAALSGGSGIVEAFQRDSVNSDPATLSAEALGLLRANALDVTRIRWSTVNTRPVPGQMVTVDVGWYALDGTWLIDHVERHWEIGSPDDFLRTTAEATSAEPSGRPIDALATLLRGGGGGMSVPGSIAFGQPGEMIPPIAANFSWVNQGSASEDTGLGGIFLSHPAAATPALHLKIESAPVGSYTLTAKLMVSRVYPYGAAGIVLREAATGHIITFGLHQTNEGTRIQQWAGTSIADAGSLKTNFGARLEEFQKYLTLRIRDDQETGMRTYYVLLDGTHETKIFEHVRDDYFIADQIGVYLWHSDSYPTGVWAVSWDKAIG